MMSTEFEMSMIGELSFFLRLKIKQLKEGTFLQHRCDWNETVIRQFYATLEINMVEEKIWWKTRKRVYYATFAQFATANQLDYEFLKMSKVPTLC